VAALPVWANAENVSVTARTGRTRKELLFIGSVVLLGTWFRGMNFDICSDRFFSQRWAALNDVFAAMAAAVGKAASIASIAHRICGRAVHPGPLILLAWIISIIKASLPGRQTNLPSGSDSFNLFSAVIPKRGVLQPRERSP
jgi:hypothetical protein